MFFTGKTPKNDRTVSPPPPPPPPRIRSPFRSKSQRLSRRGPPIKKKKKKKKTCLIPPWIRGRLTMSNHDVIMIDSWDKMDLVIFCIFIYVNVSLDTLITNINKTWKIKFQMIFFNFWSRWVLVKTASIRLKRVTHNLCSMLFMQFFFVSLLLNVSVNNF